MIEKKEKLKNLDEMEKEENYTRKLARAQKRVRNLKKFYNHLKAYIIVNLILLFLKYRTLDFFADKAVVHDQNFLYWFEWNVLGTPILWGIGLLFHALYVFRLKSKPLSDLKPNFLKDWEERQIQKYMEEN